MNTITSKDKIRQITFSKIGFAMSSRKFTLRLLFTALIDFRRRILARSTFLFLLQALLVAVSLFADSPCPGAAESLKYRSVGYSLMALPVRIGQSQPYVFLLDTGSQVTMVEPSLAAELGLEPQGSILVTAVSSQSPAVWTEAETVEVGALEVQSVHIVVEDLKQFKVLYPSVRGVLGEDFLTKFDFMIDRKHGLVCLDNGNRMEQEIRGEHVPLDLESGAGSNSSIPDPLLIPVHIEGTDAKTEMMSLDSGATVALLNRNKVYPDWISNMAVARGQVIGKEYQYFRLLEARDIQVGRQSLGPVVFATPTRENVHSLNPVEDGLIPAALFRRVFVSYRSGFAILSP
jgi:hypothetical protein